MHDVDCASIPRRSKACIKPYWNKLPTSNLLGPDFFHHKAPQIIQESSQMITNHYNRIIPESSRRITTNHYNSINSFNYTAQHLPDLHQAQPPLNEAAAVAWKARRKARCLFVFLAVNREVVSAVIPRVGGKNHPNNSKFGLENPHKMVLNQGF